LAFANGCRKKSISPTQIHNITRELAAAAKATAPAGSEIEVKPGASPQHPEEPDRIEIALAPLPDASQDMAVIARVTRALGQVGTRRGLTQNPSEGENGTLLELRYAGKITHRIHMHIHFQGAESESPASETQGGGRLAIILDDLGEDASAASAIFELHYPLTLSVLPYHAHSAEIAEEAHRRGYHVMLHLPMQSLANERPETNELRPGMPPAEVERMVREMLSAVPHAGGVNNHQGSQATLDEPLMNELMPVLREEGVFYIDSRTIAGTVAYETARRDGVRSAYRSVPFLDDVAEVSAVRKQLQLAFRGARTKGSAIAIGHPHPATLQALREMLPQAQAQGVHLVFASQLAH
jgi:polysaccharide deacetylase 2 family uncharacterized protein YibQ